MVTLWYKVRVGVQGMDVPSMPDSTARFPQRACRFWFYATPCMSASLRTVDVLNIIRVLDLHFEIIGQWKIICVQLCEYNVHNKHDFCLHFISQLRLRRCFVLHNNMLLHK